MLNLFKNIIFCMVFVTSSFAIDNFEEPECLKANIDFWENVYVKYGRDDIIFHDKNSMKVYLVKNIWFYNPIKSKYIKRTMDSLSSEYPTVEFRAQQGIKEMFSDGLKRSQKYLPMIKKQLKDAGMPEALAYLPHVESSFNPKALSKMGARGLWQIMPKTGKLYGVRNKNDLYDPNKATPAALRILKHNFDEAGSWELAIMSYNHGLEGVKRAKREVGPDICDITTKYSGKAFRFASKNFYAQFLAIQRIAKCFD